MNGKFGEFIAEKRKSRGLTLRGLAAELGIVPAYMSDIEKGHRYPLIKINYTNYPVFCACPKMKPTPCSIWPQVKRKTLCLLICRNISWEMSKYVLHFVWHVTTTPPVKYGKKSLK